MINQDKGIVKKSGMEWGDNLGKSFLRRWHLSRLLSDIKKSKPHKYLRKSISGRIKRKKINKQTKKILKKECIHSVFTTARRRVLLELKELKGEKFDIRWESSQRPDARLWSPWKSLDFIPVSGKSLEDF